MRIVFNIFSAISLLSAVVSLLVVEITLESAFMILVGLLGGVAWALVSQLWLKVESLEQRLTHLEKLRDQA